MKNLKTYATLGLTVLLSGCLDSDSDSSNYSGIECDTAQIDMVVQTISADYTSSSVAIGCSEGGLLDGNLISNKSDYTVSAGNSSFYYIGKGSIDTVSQYDFLLPDVENWKYATNDANESTSNTYKLVEVNEEKAYLIRYNKSKVWIVNPSAQNSADFKIGELDLDNYLASSDSTTSTATDMSDAVIVDGKLFIAMQRLRNGSQNDFGDVYDYTNNSMIAVFDIATDAEIDASPEDDTFNAITLTGKNVQTLNVLGNEIFVSSRGNYFDSFGLLESIDATSYQVTTLVEGSAELGAIVDFTATSTTQGFVLTDLSGYVDEVYTSKHNLYSLDLETSEIGAVLDGFNNIHLTDIATGPNSYLWVLSADASNPGVYKINASNIEESIFLETNLNPSKIAFKL